MYRFICSKWFVSGVSLTVGVGVGASLSTVDTGESHGLLSIVPVIPIPSVDAATDIVPYQGGGAGQMGGNRSTAVMKYGFPSLANIKTRESYVTSYDPRNRTAAWVIEHLTPQTLTGTSDRKFCDFKEDDSVHMYHRSTNADYKGSGFDRGHLAAAGNHKWNQKAMDDTFYLSNVSPQVSTNSHGLMIQSHSYNAHGCLPVRLSYTCLEYDSLSVCLLIVSTL